MSDVQSGLIVAAVTAVAVAGIFFWAGRSAQRKIAALQELCRRHGWAYESLAGRLQRGQRIAGDGWTLEAVSRSSGREAGPGSSDWDHVTLWSAHGEDPGRGTFIIGLNPGGTRDLPRLSADLFARFLGPEAAGMRPYPAGGRLEPRFVLLAREAPPAMGFLDGRSQELLAAWPAALPLVVRSSPARLELRLTGRRLEKPEDVERLVKLGQSFLGE
jgi:hypothetical protein